MSQARAVMGQSPPRPDGPGKVSGRALFIDDMPFVDLWHGATVRCPHAKARIVRIDTSAVSDREAVFVTAKDLPGPNVVRAIAEDWRVLADDVALHAYEAVVLVAAPTAARAQAAAAEVRVEYEPLPAVLTYEQALAQGAEGLLASSNLAHGDVERALAQEGVRIIEGTYETGHQEHLYLEPNGIVAEVHQSGEVEITGSLQCPFYVQRALKYVLGIDAVRVRQATTGGGFGGKEDCPSLVAAHAALLARRSGHAVKIVYGRREDIVATSKRHPSRVHIKSAVRADGTFVAHDIDVLFDGGVYITMSPVVLARGALHASGPYRCPNVRVRARAVRTNTCPNGAFRGFGAPQTQFAMERHVDRIARALGIDPLSIRERNAFVEGDETSTGQILQTSVSAKACLAEAEQRTGFRATWGAYEKARRARTPLDGRPQRGIGLSLFWHGAGFTGNGEKRIMGTAAVALLEDGTVEVRAASTDIGQGTEVAFGQIAASAGIPATLVRVVLADTGRVPDSGPTVASRTIMVVGELVLRAAADLVSAVCAHAAKEQRAVGIRVREVDLVDGQGRTVSSFAEAARSLARAAGPQVFAAQYRPLAEQQFDEKENRGMAYPAFAWGCDVVEVEVDPDTFETRPTKVTAISDVGFVVHPVLCHGQVIGGTLQAIGWGYLEEMKLVEGRYQNDRFATYIVPTSRDVPAMESVLIENPGPVGPRGAKGIGEAPMDGGAPALLSAIENATGLVLATIPATPERLYAAQRAGAHAGAAEAAR